MLGIINFIFGVNITTAEIKPFVYGFGIVIIVGLIYFVLWKRLSYYADLMNREVAKMWTEAGQVIKENSTRTVKNIKMNRLKREYGTKIDKAKSRRDFILRYTPFMKKLYSKTIKKDAPVFLTLPAKK
ncbi:MAG: hypothetical protein R3346_01275 [Candidatus Spechtbacterales bacterium]|nr:hypothetical protein [Candidatus Spechtbacterales bacterium]